MSAPAHLRDGAATADQQYRETLHETYAAGRGVARHVELRAGRRQHQYRLEARTRGVPGVGPVKAQAIIDYRKANGAFKSVEDVDKVKGIGDKTFERLKGAISVSGASSAPANAAAPAAPAKMEPAKTAGPAPAAAKSESTKAAVPASAAPIRSDDKKSAAEDKATKAKADKDVKAKEKTDQSAMAKTVDKDAKSKDKPAKDSKSKDAKSRDAKDKEETPKK